MSAKKQAPRGSVWYSYLPRYPYADAAAPAEGVDYPTPRRRRKSRVCYLTHGSGAVHRYVFVQQGTVSSPNPTYDR